MYHFFMSCETVYLNELNTNIKYMRKCNHINCDIKETLKIRNTWQLLHRIEHNPPSLIYNIIDYFMKSLSKSYAFIKI
jgi:hypothetical protein